MGDISYRWIMGAAIGFLLAAAVVSIAVAVGRGGDDSAQSAVEGTSVARTVTPAATRTPQATATPAAIDGGGAAPTEKKPEKTPKREHGDEDEEEGD